MLIYCKSQQLIIVNNRFNNFKKEKIRYYISVDKVNLLIGIYLNFKKEKLRLQSPKQQSCFGDFL